MSTGNHRTENERQASRDDYLWDGAGEPDPEIRRFETLLARVRHNRPAPEFPEFAPAKRFKFLSWRMGLFPALATAAAAVVATVVLLHRAPASKSAPAILAGWDVSRVEGTPRIGNAAVSGEEGMSRFAVGQILETDPQSRARL